MAAQGGRRANARLPPEVNRALYIKNLPFKISAEEMYDIFGKYGAIRQIRLGDKTDTRGTAFVIYEDIYDAKNAVDHLSGFNKNIDNNMKKKELDDLKSKYSLDGKE